MTATAALDSAAAPLPEGAQALRGPDEDEDDDEPFDGDEGDDFDDDEEEEGEPLRV